MILSAHQPCYIPWMGFFNKIYHSDVFILLDDVQFEKGGYINRTKIKSPAGSEWMTLPVGQHPNRYKIKDISLRDSGWESEHWCRLRHNYTRASYWDEITDSIGLPNYRSQDLRSLNLAWIFQLSAWFDFKTQFVLQSTERFPGTKSEMIINMCKHYGADTFLFGEQGRGYADEELFKKAGITPVYQNFSSFEYRQLWGDFIPGLSVLDALFNVGVKETKELIVKGFSL